MPITLTMPALSPTMEEGTLAKWNVKVGDVVVPGDILAEIETDKATMEFETIDEGTIGAILVAEGTEGIPVNLPILILLEPGDDVGMLSDVEGELPDAPSVKSVPVEAAPAPAAMAAPITIVPDETAKPSEAWRIAGSNSSRQPSRPNRE